MSDELLPYLLNRVTARINAAWMTRLREHGLTVARWQVLSVLSRYDGSRVGTIADLAGTEQPATSRVVDQLERDGIVERRAGIDDSRSVEVWLTPAGRKLFTQLVPMASEFVTELTRNFSRDDVNTINANLERLLSDIKELH